MHKISVELIKLFRASQILLPQIGCFRSLVFPQVGYVFCVKHSFLAVFVSHILHLFMYSHVLEANKKKFKLMFYSFSAII